MSAPPAYSWHPHQYISPSPTTKFALLILNQPLENLELLRNLWMNAELVVAADGGANRLADVVRDGFPRMNLHAIVGDLDSLTEETKQCFPSPSTAIIKIEDQNHTDFTKAYRYIKKHAPKTDVVVLGGLGGRLDQGVATLNHLYTFHGADFPHNLRYQAGRVVLVTPESIAFVLKAGKHVVYVREGEDGLLGRYVGIVPKRQATISTTGLRWDMEYMVNEWGGFMSTSNQVDKDVVHIECDNDCIFTIDYSL